MVYRRNPMASSWFLIARLWLICVLAQLGFVLTLSAEEKTFNGRAYVDLQSLATSFGMRGYWLEGEKVYRLRSEWTNLDFEVNSRLLRMNELPVYLGFSPKKSGEQLYLSRADVRHVLQPIMTPQVFGPKPRYRRIVIDPGHGGRDSGARNDTYGLLEKELNLDMARRLEYLLEAIGFEVILTRESDVYLELVDRAEFANRMQADLFLSLHFNAAASVEAEGFESFALTPQFQSSTRSNTFTSADGVKYRGNAMDPWNILLSYHIQDGLVDGLGGTNRGLKRARFAVLKELNCPGVLTELGFLSHAETAQKLSTGAYREKLAQSLYNGIVGYANRIKRIP